MIELHDTLCNNHNEVIAKLTEIKKNKTYNVEDINELLTYVRFCKKQGQHMENRLRKYRYAMEGLGFTRMGKYDRKKDKSTKEDNG